MRDPIEEFMAYNRPFARRNAELIRFKIARMAQTPDSLTAYDAPDCDGCAVASRRRRDAAPERAPRASAAPRT